MCLTVTLWLTVYHIKCLPVCISPHLSTLVAPTILYPVTPDMRCYNEEQFGPLVPVARFSQLQEIYTYLQESKFGQQASVFGSDAGEIASLIDVLVNQVCLCFFDVLLKNLLTECCVFPCSIVSSRPGCTRQHQHAVSARPRLVPVHRYTIFITKHHSSNASAR